MTRCIYYIVVVKDNFSKWTEAYSLEKEETAIVTYVLVKEWICRLNINCASAALNFIYIFFTRLPPPFSFVVVAPGLKKR